MDSQTVRIQQILLRGSHCGTHKYQWCSSDCQLLDIILLYLSFKRSNFCFFFFEDFVYSIGRERDRESTSGGEAEGEGEADSWLGWESDVGLDPGTWRS